MLLLRLSVNVLPAPETPPVIPAVTDGADQEYVVFGAIAVFGAVTTGVYVNATPLHIVAASLSDCIVAVGATTMLTVNILPVQPDVVGVTL